MLDTRAALLFHDLAHGVTGTVTPLGGAPVTVTVIPDSGRNPEFAADPDTTRMRPTFDVPRALVPSLPSDSTILAARTFGGVPQLYRCIRVDDSDPDFYLAAVEVM